MRLLDLIKSKSMLVHFRSIIPPSGFRVSFVHQTSAAHAFWFPSPKALPCGRFANLLTDFRAHLFGFPPQKLCHAVVMPVYLINFRVHLLDSLSQKLCHAVASPIYSPISARIFLVPLPKALLCAYVSNLLTGELGLRFAVARLGLSQELAQLLPLRL
jgi:hypothetical protein